MSATSLLMQGVKAAAKEREKQAAVLIEKAEAAAFQKAMAAVDKSDAGLEKAFKSVDEDKSGKISVGEMMGFIRRTIKDHHGEGLEGGAGATAGPLAKKQRTDGGAGSRS